MIIAKAKAANAALDQPSNPPEGMAMVRQMKELDYNPQIIHMIQASSDRGWRREKQLGEYVAALEAWIPGLITRERQAHRRRQETAGRKTPLVRRAPVYGCAGRG
jgi:hypothetical protein